MAADNKKSTSQSAFTVDEKTGTNLFSMPSITRLLNRKKLELPKKDPTVSAPPPVSIQSPRAPSSASKPIPTSDPVSVEAPTEIFFAPPELPDASEEKPSSEGHELSLDPPASEAPGLSLDPPTSEAPGLSLDPPASEAPGLSLDPPASEAPGLSLDPPASEAPGLSLDPPASEAPGLSLDPPASEAPGLSLDPPASEAPGLSLDPSEIELPETKEPDLVEPAQEISDTEVLLTSPKPAKLRTAPIGQMHIWDLKTLKSNGDPLAKGILYLIENGADSTLYLALISPPPKSPVPHFLATAIAGDTAKQAIWNGLKWDPAIVPNVWNFFIQPGYVELSPPGASTSQLSQRNVIRGAFGLRMDEYLLMTRIGPESECRGALVIISKTSIVDHLPHVMKIFNQKSPNLTKAA